MLKVPRLSSWRTDVLRLETFADTRTARAANRTVSTKTLLLVYEYSAPNFPFKFNA